MIFVTKIWQKITRRNKKNGIILVYGYKLVIITIPHKLLTKVIANEI